MIRIKEQQQAIVESVVKHIRRVLTPLVRAHRPFAIQTSPGWDAALGAASLERSGLHHSQDPDPGGIREERQRQSAQRTLNKADVLLEDIDERIGELRALQQNAQKNLLSGTHPLPQLKDLLMLKQQQAGAIEAREAVKQA
ncbi:hypothetical protein L209DRAFT_755161 [Thermothelomyces heterothallicus CBS 203.75]